MKELDKPTVIKVLDALLDRANTFYPTGICTWLDVLYGVKVISDDEYHHFYRWFSQFKPKLEDMYDAYGEKGDYVGANRAFWFKDRDARKAFLKEQLNNLSHDV